MSELLQDNISLDNKLATAHSEGVSVSHLKSSKKHEISEDVNGLRFLSWVGYFNIYSSVLLTKHPSLAKSLTAYATMMVKEGPAIRVQGMAAVRPAILPTRSKRTNCSGLGKRLIKLSALRHFLFKSPKRGDSDLS